MVHHTHKSHVRAIITEPIIWAGVRCGLIGGEKEERRNIRYAEINDEDEEKLYAHTNCNDSLLLNLCQSIFGLLLVLKTESDAYSPVIYSGSNRDREERERERDNQSNRERERGSDNT